MKKLDVNKLAAWIESLKTDAKNDIEMSIAWFGDTKNEKLSIIGGWLEGFSEEYSDLLCISKSNPTYAMCIKIAVNEGPYAYTDFEIMNMPYDKETDEVDNTCIALEYNDDAFGHAEWLIQEWERMMREYFPEEEVAA